MAMGGNLGFKVEHYRRMAKQFAKWDVLIFSDAFDVQFFGTKEEVLRKVPREGILCAAERNCYPEPQAVIGTTPWRFFNGGLAAGTPKAFLAWLDAIERHPTYDQKMLDQMWFNRRRAEESELVYLDTQTDLFYCLFLEQDDLQFQNGLPINTLCRTHPNFIHENGHWPSTHIWARNSP
jgi:hypothetical protein